MIQKSQNKNYHIDNAREEQISQRYHTITQAINKAMWGINNNVSNSLYEGSYGRHTAIKSSDIDILTKLPNEDFDRFNNLKGNSESRLLTSIRNIIKFHYLNSDVRSDGQVVKLKFTDNMRIEILPTFQRTDGGFVYPNADQGGCWLSTFPKVEQRAMENKNKNSKWLLFDTCRQLRYIRDSYKSYQIPGIIIDSFVYKYIDGWEWSTSNTTSNKPTYEEHLLNCINALNTFDSLQTPGSNESLSLNPCYNDLRKVLIKLNDN